MSSPSPVERRYLTTAEAAEYFGVHPKTIKNWVTKGKLRMRRLPGGTLMRFDVNDLESAR